MANDIFRILQLAGLKSLNEEVNIPIEDRRTRSNYLEDDQKEDECDSMVQEDDFDAGEDAPEDLGGADQDMVTITVPRNCAEWLKNHLDEDIGVDGEEAEAVKDAIDEALCGDEGCEDPNAMYGDEDGVPPEEEDEDDMMGGDESEMTDEDISFFADNAPAAYHAALAAGTGLAHVAGAKIAQWMREPRRGEAERANRQAKKNAAKK